MKLYKLTDKQHQTKNNTQWGQNVTHTAKGGKLCTDQVLHAYKSKYQASFFKSIHVNNDYNVLWECEGEVCVEDGTKVGCTKLTTIKQVELPEFSSEKRIEIAIRCAKLVCEDEKWNAWADKWLSGEDRSKESAINAINAFSGNYYRTYTHSDAYNSDAYYAAYYAGWAVARFGYAADSNADYTVVNPFRFPDAISDAIRAVDYVAKSAKSVDILKIFDDVYLMMYI